MKMAFFRILFAALGLFWGSALLAADEALVLRFPQLKLSDGRQLKDVVVKSYDTKSEKVLVIANGKAMTLPVALFPAPLNETLKGAPASGETVNTFTPPPRPLATAADQYYIERPAPVHIFTPTPAPPMRAVPVSPAPSLAEEKAVARTRAQRYYTYEYPASLTSQLVTLIDIELETPHPVPGWDGRSSVQGKAFVELYDRRNYSVQRVTSNFEVLMEQKPGESLLAIDFRVKN